VKRSGPHNRFKLENLEPRILLSADTAAASLPGALPDELDSELDSGLMPRDEVAIDHEARLRGNPFQNQTAYDPSQSIDDIFAGLSEDNQVDATEDEDEHTNRFEGVNEEEKDYSKVFEDEDEHEDEHEDDKQYESSSETDASIYYDSVISSQQQDQIVRGLNALSRLGSVLEEFDAFAAGITPTGDRSVSEFFSFVEIFDTRLAKPVFDYFNDGLDPPDTRGVLRTIEQIPGNFGDLEITVDSLDGGVTPNGDVFQFDLKMTATRTGGVYAEDSAELISNNSVKKQSVVTVTAELSLDYSFGVELEGLNEFFVVVRQFDAALFIEPHGENADTGQQLVRASPENEIQKPEPDTLISVKFADTITADSRIALDAPHAFTSDSISDLIIIQTRKKPPLTQGNLIVDSSEVLSGNRRIVGHLINYGLVSPGYSPGVQNVDTFTQTADGTLAIEIGGLGPGPGNLNPDDGYDQINVSGLATLGGTLSISLINDFQPTVGDTFEFLTFGLVAGDFAEIEGLEIGNGLLFRPVRGESGYILVVEPQPTIIWDGNTDGDGDGTSWHDPLNWDLDRLPNAGDDVLIDVPGEITVTQSTGTRAVNTLTSYEAFNLAGGVLATAGPSTFNNLFNFTAGALRGEGSVSLKGDATWSAGGMELDGEVVVEAGATLTLSGSDGKGIDTTLKNKGTVNYTGGNLQFGPTGRPGAVIANLAGGVFNADGNGNFTRIRGKFHAFNNAGTFNRAGPGTTAFSNVGFNNTGVLNVTAGTFRPSGGSTHSAGRVYTVGPGAAIDYAQGTHRHDGDVIYNGEGTVRLAAILKLNGGAQVTFDLPTGGFHFTAGALRGEGSVS